MEKMNDEKIKIKSITNQDFPLIEELFGPNGACEGCWCMYWRVNTNKEYKEGRGAKNKNWLEKLVKNGKIHALVALYNGKPAGWCTFGPRESFKRLRTYRTLQREVHPGLWSIVCFFTDLKFRKKGISNILLEKAVDECFKNGASEIEGFPVKATRENIYTYTGIIRQFERLGFQHMKREGEKRPIYVLTKSKTS
jgi:GNAT superfamily N-acetyltransferase